MRDVGTANNAESQLGQEGGKDEGVSGSRCKKHANPTRMIDNNKKPHCWARVGTSEKNGNSIVGYKMREDELANAVGWHVAGNFLHQALQYIAGAHFRETIRPIGHHIQHTLRPTNRSG